MDISLHLIHRRHHHSSLRHHQIHTFPFTFQVKPAKRPSGPRGERNALNNTHTLLHPRHLLSWCREMRKFPENWACLAMWVLFYCPKNASSSRWTSFVPLMKHMGISSKRLHGSERRTIGRVFSSSTPLCDPTDSDESTWTNHQTAEKRTKRRNNQNRFRQHVNPLSRKFQQPTVLTSDWPNDVFDDVSLPLHLDIGCGKGGFLLDMATASSDKNYLGLEIRPSVAQLAQERVTKRKQLTGRLCFVGCNANVDLERLLSLHKAASENAGPLDMVSIQFPDPHFKSSHAKRRVVTPELVTSLATFMPEGAQVFLQSDIKSVLDEMRLQFRTKGGYFQDEIVNVDDYMESNPLGVETERERSVIAKELPVYRTMLQRTTIPVE